MTVSPTQRSLSFCKERSWPYKIVETFNPHVKVRTDMWGVGDILVLDDEPGVLLVQACAGASHAARRTKVENTIRGISTDNASKTAQANMKNKSAALQNWLRRGCRIEVWSWSKTGPAGKRKLWTLRRERIHLPDTERLQNENA